MNANQLRKKKAKANKKLRKEYMQVRIRKFYIQNTLQKYVQYYVETPENISPNMVVEEFEKLGTLVYSK